MTNAPKRSRLLSFSPASERAAMDRRELFRIAARLGVGVSTLSILGCSGNTETSPSSSSALQLTIVSASTCAPLAGRAVYLWHCDALGRYSLYSSGATNQNYLRGVQEADAGGTSNLAQVSLASDGVFSDGSALALATIMGSVASGFTATLTVAV